jgi:hypothetical protein
MREAHVCATCRTVLDWWVPVDGSAPAWVHSVRHRAEDTHRPVPVPQREMTEVRSVCDYCGTPDPTVTFVMGETVTFVVGERLRMLAVSADGLKGGAVDGDGLWSACRECADLVDAGSAARLTARVARHIDAVRERPALRAELYQMYAVHLAVPRLRVDKEEDA